MKKNIFLFILTSLPATLFAADFVLAGSKFKDILTYVTRDLVVPLFYILESIAFIIFFYGLIKFVIKADSEEELKKGKQYMLWGILALFILISFQTIINLLSSEFGTGGDSKKIPLLPTGGQQEQVDSTFTPHVQ